MGLFIGEYRHCEVLEITLATVREPFRVAERDFFGPAFENGDTKAALPLSL